MGLVAHLAGVEERLVHVALVAPVVARLVDDEVELGVQLIHEVTAVLQGDAQAARVSLWVKTRSKCNQ